MTSLNMIVDFIVLLWADTDGRADLNRFRREGLHSESVRLLRVESSGNLWIRGPIRRLAAASSLMRPKRLKYPCYG